MIRNAMRYGMAVVAVAGLLLSPMAPASAAVLNYGVDISCQVAAHPTFPTSAKSCTPAGSNIKQVGASDGTGFYDGQPTLGGNDGTFLGGASTASISFSIITGGLAGLSIVAANLFVDANNVSINNLSQVYGFDVDTATDILLGTLAKTSNPLTNVHTVGGPVGTQISSPYDPADIDNSFFDVPVSLWDEILDGSLTVTVLRNGSSVRVDGVNLQIEAIEDISGSAEDIGGVPEPATMLLLGSGLLAAGIGGRFVRSRGRK